MYEERVGQGRVIAFAEDVNFRGFWGGANRLFLNAAVLGPNGDDGRREGWNDAKTEWRKVLKCRSESLTYWTGFACHKEISQ